MTDPGSEQQQVVYYLLSADDYWKALCSIKAIDQALSGIGEERIVGKGPQTDVAASLLDLVNDFEDKEFLEVWDDFETAVPSGADHEFRNIDEEIGTADARVDCDPLGDQIEQVRQFAESRGDTDE